MNDFCLTQCLVVPITVTPETSITDVITLMDQQGSSCVLVREKNQLLGMIIERDIIKLLANRNNLEKIQVTEVINKDIITLKTTDAKLDRIIDLFINHHLNYLPVLDEDHQLLGVISSESLMKVLLVLKTKVSKLNAQQQKRQEIESALADIEQRYATLVDAAPVGIFRTDIEGNCLYVNDRWCQITGLTRSEAMGTGWLKGLYPEDQQIVTQAWEQGIQTNIPFRAEYRFIRPNGRVIWVVGQAVEEKSKQGQLLGYIGTVTDISDRKAAEEALAKNEATILAILKALPDMLFRHNQHGTFIGFISKGDLEPLIAPQEFLGKRPIDVLPPDIGKMSLNSIQEAIRTHELQTFEYQLELNDENRDYEARVVSTSQGEVLSIVRDISDRKQALKALQKSEARFRSYFELPLIGLAITSPDKNWIEVNDKLCDILGYSREELTQMTWEEITYPDDLATDLFHFQQMLAGEKDTYSTEKRYIRKDGQIIYTSISVGCVRYCQTKKVDYFVGLVQDITDRKKAEAELHQLNLELEARVERRTLALKTSLEEKELLLKEVHHRVKNNLQVISSLLSLQSQYLEDAKTLAILEDSQNRISSMALIHEKLYESENLAKIDFADYIKTLAHYLFTSYHRHSQSIRLNFNVENISLNLDQAIPCGLLLSELVSNSLKHAFSDPREDSGEINIDFSLNSYGQFYLKVEDNGIGLPEGLNLQSTPSLGLRLVRALTRQLKGKLEIGNNGGAVFALTFPQH